MRKSFTIIGLLIGMPAMATEPLCGRRATARAARFTLIELLVVIAIIGILASLLLPGLSRARYRARQTMEWRTAVSAGLKALAGKIIGL